MKQFIWFVWFLGTVSPQWLFLLHIPSSGFKCPLLLISPASLISYLLDGNGSCWDETTSCYSFDL